MKKIILIITGSIAANKGIELYFHLQKHYQVNLFLTKNAEKFIENIPNNNENSDWQTANLLVVYPASHNFIAKIAHGVCDEKCSEIFNAFLFTKMVFPVMNTNMYENKANLRNCDLLKTANIKVFKPKIGVLACKRIGIGRAWEWQEVANLIDVFFKNKIIINIDDEHKNVDAVI